MATTRTTGEGDELGIEAYPLPKGETVDSWREQCLVAEEQISREGKAELKDSLGQPLSEHLAALAVVPIDPLLESCPGRVRLAGNLMRNVAFPGRINQGHKGTCSVTTVESYLAARDPGEYCRLIVGLLSPSGRVSLRGGEELRRDESLLKWNEAEAGRSPVSRLFQVAAMEMAFPNQDYRNIPDGHFSTEEGEEEKNTGTGINIDAFDRLLEQVTGQRWDTLSMKQHHIAALLKKIGLGSDSLPDFIRDGMTIIRRSTKAGESCFVTLVWSEKLPEGTTAEELKLFALPHKVRVLSVDDEKQRVIFEDPLDPETPWLPRTDSVVEDSWGRCNMSLADFDQLLSEISYRPEFWTGKE